MRADRLLALLMLLQTRGRLPAYKIAETLEVSERTVYRDIEALAIAGVPVYAESGPGGGCGLLDSYRTNLTGLTGDEVRALFMLSIPAPLSRLGVGQELQAALLKLAAALPAAGRQAEERVRQRIFLDSAWWFHPEEPLPHLNTLYQAVWNDRRVKLKYGVMFNGEVTPVELLVDPYGLVAKSSTWYLVAALEGGLRVYRAGQVLEAAETGEQFARNPQFELPAFWKSWCNQIEQRQAWYPVKVRVAPGLLPELERQFGVEIGAEAAKEPPGPDGWLTMTLPFERLEDARSRLLGYGRAVEVLEPEALRRSLADFALQIVSRYKI